MIGQLRRPTTTPTTRTETSDDRPEHAGCACTARLRTPRVASTDELREIVSHVGAELELAPAEDIIEWAVATFGERFCVTSSMSDAVLSHLASRVSPGIDVLFLDTGYHFAETIGTRDAVEATMPVNLINLTPVQSVAEQDAAYGKDLFERDPDLCCALRKVQPLADGLAEYDAWATGLRRAETHNRVIAPVVGWDEKKQKVKVSPLARWTDEDVEKYIAENGILVNPLQYDGYPSIGCWPCTRRVAPGEDARSRPLGPAPTRPSAGSTNDHPIPTDDPPSPTTTEFEARARRETDRHDRSSPDHPRPRQP